MIARFFEKKEKQPFVRAEEEVLADPQRQIKYVHWWGIVISPQNRDLLKQNPENIYLKADFETLTREFHLIRTINVRFLNNSKEDLEAIFNERQIGMRKWLVRLLMYQD